MNNVWLTSDTHFNHENIITYCDRPIDHEIRQYIELEKLTENDILLHLGDVCMGKDEEMHDKYIKPLKCKKWLILGNHDKKSISWYVAHGWDFAAYGISMNFMGQALVFSHRPLPVSGDFINIHGHLHNLERIILESYPDEFLGQPEKHILVSPELNKYKLVKLKTLLKRKLK